jgi:hypothetical protein
MKRRYLVLGDESARHPFRQSLPPHVTGGRSVACRPVAEKTEKRFALPRFSMQDWRDFLMAYCACFMAVSAFIW